MAPFNGDAAHAGRAAGTALPPDAPELRPDRRGDLSRNTVKTQAIAVYRKLGATSRGAAVDRALAAGLLDP